MAVPDDPPPEPSCRVCYDAADGESGGVLLAPCQCHGTLRFIHQRCLEEWLQHAPPATRMLCSVCHSAFALPPGFVVPPTDYNQQLLQEQVWDAAEEAAAAAEHQEGRLRVRQPWPLGLTLVVGGTAAAMVAAALLSVRLSRRYHAQQLEQWWQQMQDKWRRQAEELRRRRREQRRRYRKWLQEQHIPQLQAEGAQLKAQLAALRTHQRLDRWLPPPLVGRRQRRAERAIAAVKQELLEAELSANAFFLAVLDLRKPGGSNSGSDSDEGSSQGSSATARSNDEDGSSGGNTEPPSRPSHHPRQAAGEDRRHKLAEPVLRAVHSLLHRLRRQ